MSRMMLPDVEEEPVAIRSRRERFMAQFNRISMTKRMKNKEKRRRSRGKMPKCFIFLLHAYHKYGLKHLILLMILLLYSVFGAFIFYVIEEPHQEYEKLAWSQQLNSNRTKFVAGLMKSMFNNSKYLVFLPKRTSDQFVHHFGDSLLIYEAGLGLKWTDMKIEWNFPNSMLFTMTIFTTIGYGHIYPRTNAGKVLTMVYSLGGIPLVLLVLQDLGRLLTVSLKFPWFQCKRGYRRIVRLCTKRSIDDIHQIEMDERNNLAIFDLPVPVAVGLVVGWIFLCSATFCIWETQWSYLEAFYFFFISLSTIGLGDLAPTRPQFLLMMFGYIIIGLSLVSMCVNLLQIKLEKTYEAGPGVVSDQLKHHVQKYALPLSDSAMSGLRSSSMGTLPPDHQPPAIGTTHCDVIGSLIRMSVPRGALGIFQSRSCERVDSPAMMTIPEHLMPKKRSVTTQTPEIIPEIATRRAIIMSDTLHWVDDEDNEIDAQAAPFFPNTIPRHTSSLQHETRPILKKQSASLDECNTAIK